MTWQDADRTHDRIGTKSELTVIVLVVSSVCLRHLRSRKFRLLALEPVWPMASIKLTKKVGYVNPAICSSEQPDAAIRQ